MVRSFPYPKTLDDPSDLYESYKIKHGVTGDNKVSIAELHYSSETTEQLPSICNRIIKQRGERLITLLGAILDTVIKTSNNYNRGVYGCPCMD